MTNTSEIKQIAQKIIDLFFNIGATVTSTHCEYVVEQVMKAYQSGKNLEPSEELENSTWFKAKAAMIRDEVLEEAISAVPEERLERWTEACRIVVDEKSINFNICRAQTLENLQALKNKEQ